MVAFPLSVIALAAGVYLLIKVKREFLGKAFEFLAWLIIALSLVSVGFIGYKAVNRVLHGCKNMSNCAAQMEQTKGGNDTESYHKVSPYSQMNGCKIEGDSVVMESAVCEKMMGKEACETMRKERGRCIMSNEECMEMCHPQSGCTKGNEEKKECCKKVI